MTVQRLLVTGVSGYIGGTLLTYLLENKSLVPEALSIAALVRSAEQKSILESTLGVETIMFKDWDDTEALEVVARDFDIIIHVGAGWHIGSAKAFITGLAHRKQQTGEPVHYFQMSGSGTFSDLPHSMKMVDGRLYSDKDDIYQIEKTMEETTFPHPVRQTNLTTVDTGHELGVHTYIVSAPAILGLGTGPFNKFSMQLPWNIKAVLKSQQAFVIGQGSEVWSYVNILDLVDLFTLMLERIRRGDELPHGREGFYFAESGEVSHLGMVQSMARAMKALGVLEKDDVKNASVEEAAGHLTKGHLLFAEFAWGSNSRIKGERSREIGWKPTRGQTHEETIEAEIKAVVENPPAGFELPEVMQKDGL